MADVMQLHEEKNLSFVSGDDFTFNVSFVGNITTYSHSAFVYDGHKKVATFSVTPVFSTPNTVVTFTLTDAQTIAATSTPYNWYYIQINGTDTRTILAGSVTVHKR